MNGEEAGNILQFIRFSGLPAAALVVAVMWFAAGLLGRWVNQLGDRFTQWRLLIQQVGTLIRFGLYIFAIAVAGALSLRLSEQAMLALSGTIAVTAGFAFKDLASSVLAGVTVLLDRPFQVGDRVRFADYYGEITAIGLRSVRLTTLDDNLITIPNNKFLTEAVSCGNAGALDMLVQMDFFIGVDQDVTAARSIVADAITSSRYAFLDKPWVVLVNQVVHQGYFAIRLRAKVYVLDLHFEKALETDVTLRVLDGLRQAEVRPPAVIVRGADGSSRHQELPSPVLAAAREVEPS